jgi:peroxiredoxin
MTMKKYYWLMFSLVILSCSRDEPVQVRGIVNDGTGKIYLDEQGLGEIRKIDSARIRQNGRFVLKDRIGVPTFYNLHMGNRQIIPLLLQPGQTVEVRTSTTGFTSNYELSGSEESLYLHSLNEHLERTMKSMDSLAAIYGENAGADEEILDGIRTAYQEVIQAQRRFNIGFIIEHLNSMAAIYALYQKFDDGNFILNSTKDIQLFKITSVALDTLYPESEYVQSLKRDADNMVSELKALKLQRIMETLPTAIPEIRLPDPDGDTIALSSIENKVILLSFWASWNLESISLNQVFKRLYDRYHPAGLEIYQVSFDNDPDSWKAAIRYDELQWINVSELSYPESSVAGRYNITELPSYFLIDRQGQIVGRDFDQIALDRKISELVNQN